MLLMLRHELQEFDVHFRIDACSSGVHVTELYWRDYSHWVSEYAERFWGSILMGP